MNGTLSDTNYRIEEVGLEGGGEKTLNQPKVQFLVLLKFRQILAQVKISPRLSTHAYLEIEQWK